LIRETRGNVVLCVGIFFALVPLSGLTTEVALGVKSYPSITLLDNPERSL